MEKKMENDMETGIIKRFIGIMSYSLSSLKGGYIGDYIGTTIGDIKGDTRSLDYGSFRVEGPGSEV